MRLAHLILAHKNPQQLERLVLCLGDEETDIYIHLDKKVAIEGFDYLGRIKNVFFIKSRVKVYWGAFSVVRATLNSFQEILSDNPGIYSHINLLSGEDYPLKRPDEIKQFFFNNPGMSFMHTLNISEEWQDGMQRVRKFHFGDYRIPGRYLLQYVANMIIPGKKVPDGIVFYGRSQWLTITPDCASYVINYLHFNPDVKRHFRMSFGADEFLFQTILMNSYLRVNVNNDNLRFIDFPSGDIHPKVLTIKDAKSIKTSNKFFARKFDSQTDTAILDYLDRLISKKSKNRPTA